MLGDLILMSCKVDLVIRRTLSPVDKLPAVVTSLTLRLSVREHSRHLLNLNHWISLLLRID